MNVPTGWKLVPDCETPEWRENLSKRGYSHKSVFRDVLAAAPAAPAAVVQAEPSEAKSFEDQWVSAIRKSEHLCPSDLSAPDRWKWKAQYVRAELAQPSAQDKLDAERYRWIRQMIWDGALFKGPEHMKHGAELDAATDAARSAK